MSTPSNGQLQDLGAVALDSARELERINSVLFEKLARKNMEIIDTALSAGSKLVSLAGTVQGYETVVADQFKVVADYNEKFLAAAQDTAEIIFASGEEYRVWLDKRLHTVVESLPATAAKRPAKKAVNKAA